MREASEPGALRPPVLLPAPPVPRQQPPPPLRQAHANGRGQQQKRPEGLWEGAWGGEDAAAQRRGGLPLTKDPVTQVGELAQKQEQLPGEVSECER